MSTAVAEPGTLAVLQSLIILAGAGAMGAIGGGIASSPAPQGEIIQMPVSQLDDSPFHSDLIPWSICCGARRSAARGHDRRVALLSTGWWASGVVGVGSSYWIAVELTIITFSWFHVAYAMIGLLDHSRLPARSVRRYCGVVR